MTDTKLKSVEGGKGKTPAFGNLVTDQARKVGGKQKVVNDREPQMRALRRILGDQVLELFPEEVRKAVHAGYDFFVTHNDSFLETLFDSEDEKKDALIVMRAYAECADDDGYTISTRGDDDPCMLVWRTVNRRKNKPKGDDGDAS